MSTRNPQLNKNMYHADFGYRVWGDNSRFHIPKKKKYRKRSTSSALDCQPFSAPLCLSVKQLLSLLPEPFPFAVSPFHRFTVSSGQVIRPTHPRSTHTRDLLLGSGVPGQSKAQKSAPGLNRGPMSNEENKVCGSGGCYLVS